MNWTKSNSTYTQTYTRVCIFTCCAYTQTHTHNLLQYRLFPTLMLQCSFSLIFDFYHCWVFQIGWHIECSTITASSFKIWNSSGGILSPPLALFMVMLPKVHLTSHSRISGSRWVTTPSWFFRSLRPFLYSSVYSCHLFLSSSASVRSWLFLSFLYCAHPYMKYSLDISSFLEEISMLSHFYCFPLFLSLFT